MFAESQTNIGSVGFSGKKRATVVNNVDPLGEGRVAVTIKQLQPKVAECEEPTPADTKRKLNKDRIANKDDNTYSEEIQDVNFIWCRPMTMRNCSATEKTSTNQQVKNGGHQTQEIGTQLKDSAKYNAGGGAYNVPRIGTDIYIEFEDGDPQKPYWLPFSPSIAGQAPPMKNVESRGNAESITNMVNIEVISEGHNGAIMYFDRNDDKGNFVIKLDNGTRIKMENNAKASGVIIDTAKGHCLRIIDKSSNDGTDNAKDNNDQDGENGGSFITLLSAKGHIITLDDNSVDKIMLKNPKGNTLTLDNVKELISAVTTAGHTILMDDPGKKILIQTAEGQFIDMDDSAGVINIKSKSGSLVV